MTRSRWKVILPKRGSIFELLSAINENLSSCLDVIINKSELEQITDFTGKIKQRSVEAPYIHFTTFRPLKYQAKFSLTLPNIYQLPRSVHGESILNKHRPRSSQLIAKQNVCETIMLAHFGEEKYYEEMKWHQSPLDFLFYYHNKEGLSRPEVHAYITQRNPNKSTAIVQSDIIGHSGTISLRGEQHTTYGSALHSTCQTLEKFLKDIQILS